MPLPSSAFSKYCFSLIIQTELLLQFFFLRFSTSDAKTEIVTAKKSLASYRHFLYEHPRKKDFIYHEFFTAKKISLPLFHCSS